MVATITQYHNRINTINEKAALFRQAVINPQVESANTNRFITDNAERNSQLKAVVKDTIFDAAGEQGPLLLGVTANAVRAYYDQRGCLPSAEMMASAYHTIENMLVNTANHKIMDAATSTSEGIIKRNHQVALIVPTMLTSITNDMVTHIPPNYDKSEIFAITRRAGSTFGDLKKGDLIDYSFHGQYSSMNQRQPVATGDGTTKEFTKSIGMPVRKELVRVYHDRNLVAEDLNGRGLLSGHFVDADGQAVTVTGSVDHDNGGITINFSVPPKNGIEIHVAYDVSIEKDPSLIPKIDHEMESWIVYPHESAIAASATIQAVFSARREFSIDLNALNFSSAKNILAAEKDRRRLIDMYFFAMGNRQWKYTVPSALKFTDHYETLRQTFYEISQDLMYRTKKSGLVGIIAGPKASALLKSIGAPHVKMAPGYRHTPQPHYVGKVFEFDFKEDPFAPDWQIFCYAKGRDHGDSGYVAADAISAINYQHPIDEKLRHSNTLYELAYRDLHPKNGRTYYTLLTLVP
ncbi:hypothetical protein [Spartinivicinus marinus]|uniref:hypothetical protein n=1 Tax=Spartinivicinus marinus TaxID=2994442 RepID=UPI00225AD5EE|nr:hypothetical protein [Spartinivicinus marinus]MCX4030359.1 hypothetical protein [Spartinivicinus marinus]